MAKKQTGFKTQGMNRDLSVSAFNPEFSFENMNLRLSTNEGNTLLSWVTEKGTYEFPQFAITDKTHPIPLGLAPYMRGIAIGTAILNDQLVIFTTNGKPYYSSLESADHIFVIDHFNSEENSFICSLLYEGNLGFDVSHPLETLVSYESEDVQKVYWVDGINQPRFINIKATDAKIQKWIGTNNYRAFFDFVPALNLGETFTVSNNKSSGGTFAPGVIQYCYTYINKYGQQSNIVQVSPLYYLSYNDRGAAPDAKVTNTFTLSVAYPDSNFDYVRFYSIHRSALDGPLEVKLLEDIPIVEDTSVTYVDNGTTGSVLDPLELLYVGGKEIIAGTLMDKDNTLFLGNLTEKNSSVAKVQEYFRENQPTKTFAGNKTLALDSVTGVYGNTHQLADKNQQGITTFKGGENYRFGFQLQKYTGEWSEPIWVGDAENTLYPSTSGSNVSLVTASATINLDVFNTPSTQENPNPYYIKDFKDIYKKIRPVVVFPTVGDRKVLCQGVLNPTVFNVQDRKSNSPYAQASWYFRPYMVNIADGSGSTVAENVIVNGQPSSDYPTAAVTAFPTDPYDPSTCVLNPNNSFINRTLKYVFIMVGDVAQSAIASILANGYVEKVLGSDSNVSVPFNGAIKLASGTTTDTYAFISDYPWDENTEYGYRYITNSKFSPINPAMQMYSNLQINNSHLYYYIEPDGAPTGITPPISRCYFNFYVGNYSSDPGENTAVFYSVSFDRAVKGGNAYKPQVQITTLSSGNSIPFTHFDSLITDDSATSLEDSRRVEIQGSVQSYENIFTNEEQGNSNTQFFVDQSIVTLNSPDIEFNTNVQTFGTENLKLRVIGMIPITANASAHHIYTKTPMLELGHNSAYSDYSEFQKRMYDDIVGKSPYSGKFGTGEKNTNVMYFNRNTLAGNRLVSEYLWNDIQVIDSTEADDGISTSAIRNYLVYPWQREGSLNNDYREASEASSVLNIKRESNILFSELTHYFGYSNSKNYTSIDVQFPLTENAEVMNYRLSKQSKDSSSINYYPNIDKILYNGDGYYPKVSDAGIDMKKVTTPVAMRYLSTSHAVISLGNSETSNTAIPILPYGTDGSTGYYGKYSSVEGTPFWDNSHTEFQYVHTTGGITIPTIVEGGAAYRYNYLWLGEIYKTPVNPFGGTSDEAIRSNKWVVGGNAVAIGQVEQSSTTFLGANLLWNVGDTYYQRYDCLKTYAMTNEDANQLVEILSFMCESRVNIDGRYDRNRGQIDNTRMRPQNFNLWNPAYSQTDNFFTYQQINDSKKTDFYYPNQIFYTKTKTSGADVDLWTNVTLGSVLELDGDKGNITSLQRFNDQLIAFQDTGISQILYNENMQISTTEGVPIEIANSGKVTGNRYISNSIGCSNKWSIVTTPSGLYFMDDHDKNIYMFNGQLNNLSVTGGFNSWCKQTFSPQGTIWSPGYTEDGVYKGFKNFVGYYDKLNQDVLWINKDIALAFSEKIGKFTSFYDYGGAPYFCNFEDAGLWLTSTFDIEGTVGEAQWHTKIHKHQSGNYCQFFGVNKPYWMTLVGNPEPQMDKIFTNLEFRACVDGEGSIVPPNGGNTVAKYEPFIPFDSLESWDEYQHGIAQIGVRNDHAASLHHLDNTDGAGATLKRKFRIWRCDVPRDNCAINAATENAMGIYRHYRKPNDRMRNPWVYLKLMKGAAASSSSLPRAEIHDVILTYYS